MENHWIVKSRSKKKKRFWVQSYRRFLPRVVKAKAVMTDNWLNLTHVHCIAVSYNHLCKTEGVVLLLQKQKN